MTTYFDMGRGQSRIVFTVLPLMARDRSLLEAVGEMRRMFIVIYQPPYLGEVAERRLGPSWPALPERDVAFRRMRPSGRTWTEMESG